MTRTFFVLLMIVSLTANAAQIAVSDREAASIGRKVWQNECAGTVAGLTSWNAGEKFASLGIGHFIWYPRGQRGPFEESFPQLVDFLQQRGIKIPAWLHGDCPWNSRAEFLRDAQSSRLAELRKLLASTIHLQAAFLVHRLETALPKMLAAAAPANREKVRLNFERVAKSPGGKFALIDYVNFKGEGTLATERYHGEGWGLLQVLENMRADTKNPVRAFSESAKETLARRVRNSPPTRHESRWLAGWEARVSRY